jgi:hypothetical protein
VLTLSKRQRKNLEMNRRTLTEIITSVDGLIDALHDRGCITSRQRQVLERTGSASGQTDKLLQLLSRKSFADVERFIGCLPEAVRHRVLCLMNETSGNVTVSCLLLVTAYCC